MPAPKLTPMAIAIMELLHEHPMHPYEMRQLMRERGLALRVRLSAGALYHTVERLTESGALEVVDTHRAGNRPERTVYALTGAGRDEYASRVLEMLAEPAEEYPQYPLALGTLADLPRDEVLGALHTRLVHLESKLATATTVEKTITERKVHPMHILDYTYLRHIWAAEYEWTRTLVNDLESERLTWPENDRGTEA